MTSRSIHLISAVVSTAMLSLTAGCADNAQKKEMPTYESISQNQFIPTNQIAALALLERAKPALSSRQPLIVATLVDINALERSSTMGRLISEQISGAFSRSGYHMIEMKFRENVYIKKTEGELLLTREITDVALLHNAQAVIVGTYAMASDIVYINLKVVQPGSNIVLAAHDYALPIDNNIKAMLVR